MQQLNFGLRQQGFLPFILPGQDLRGQQLGYPLSQRAVDGAEQTVFGLIQLDSPHHPLIFPAQRNHQRGAQLALRMQRAAVRHFVTVGIHHLTGFDGAQRIG